MPLWLQIFTFRDFTFFVTIIVIVLVVYRPSAVAEPGATPKFYMLLFYLLCLIILKRAFILASAQGNGTSGIVHRASSHPFPASHVHALMPHVNFLTE